MEKHSSVVSHLERSHIKLWSEWRLYQSKPAEGRLSQAVLMLKIMMRLLASKAESTVAGSGILEMVHAYGSGVVARS
jgi:hypothetical protein